MNELGYSYSKNDSFVNQFHSSTDPISRLVNQTTPPNDTSNILYDVITYLITVPLFVLTAAGNGIILITIKCQARLLSSTSNYFILSLATADFFVGIIIMPVMIVFTANRQVWTHGPGLCDFWMSVDFLCSSASFLTLSAMSLERYQRLTTSYIHIKNSSKMRILLLIMASWLLPVCTWLPVLFIGRYFKGSDKNQCIFPANPQVVLVLSIATYHIPIIVMITLYTKLIIHIRGSSNSIGDYESMASFSKNNSFISNRIANRAVMNANNNLLKENIPRIYKNEMSNINREMSRSEENSQCNNRQSCENYAVNRINSHSATFLNKSGTNVIMNSPRRYSLGYSFDCRLNTKNNTLEVGNEKEARFIFAKEYFNSSNDITSNNTMPENKNTARFTLIRDNSQSQLNRSNVYMKFPHILSCCLAETAPASSEEGTQSPLSNCKKSTPSNQLKYLLNNSRNETSSIVSLDKFQKSKQTRKGQNQSPGMDSPMQRFLRLNKPSSHMIDVDSNKLGVATNGALTASKMGNTGLLDSRFKRPSIVRIHDPLNNGRRFTKSSIGSSLLSKKKESMCIFENSKYLNLRLKRNRKAARMLGLLVLSFCICWLPYIIVYPLIGFYPNTINENLNLFIWWLGYFNSTINPFLYVYSNKNIRRSVRILFCQRLVNFIAGNKLSENFRNNSLKKNQVGVKNVLTAAAATRYSSIRDKRWRNPA